MARPIQIPWMKRVLLGVFAFSVVFNALHLTGSLFMLQIYDRVIPSRSLPTLVGLIVLTVGLYLAQALLDQVRSRIFVRLARAFDLAVGPAVFDAVVRLPLSTPRLGDGLQPARDMATIRGFLAGGGPMVLLDLPWLPFFLAICFLFHFLIGLTATIGAVVLIAIAAVSEWLSRDSVRRQSVTNSRQLALLGAASRNAEALMSMGMVGAMSERWRKANEDQAAVQARGADIVGGLGAFSRAFRMMLQSTVLAVGAYLVINQQATGGVIIASSILTARALAPAEQVISQWRGAIAARQAWRRLSDLLKGIAQQGERFALPAPRESLVVEDLIVRPPGSAKAVASGVRLKLEAGQALAIIGHSGSGKSSLARALAGVWAASNGAVRLDGAPLSQWDPARLGAHVGYMPQDVELFAGTIAENISRFETAAESAAVIQAARLAGVHDMVLRFENGYETDIGERGAMLSKGQSQRIALARALYREPFLVVLDEPNSHLDQQGEEALTEAIVAIKARKGHRNRGRASPQRRLRRRSRPRHARRAHARLRAARRNSPARARQAAHARDSRPDADSRQIRRRFVTIAIAGKALNGPYDPLASIRRWMLAGVLIVIALVGGVGGWAVYTEIAGAVIAPGRIVVESNVKKVQHPTGGVVGELLVREGQHVEAGELLLRLDRTQTMANLDIIRQSIDELNARKARDEAERDAAGVVTFPEELTSRKADPRIARLLADEQSLFEARTAARNGQKAQYQQQIDQLDEQTRGIEAQIDANAKEIYWNGEEIKGIEELWKKKLVEFNRLTTLQREAARLQGERGRLNSDLAEMRNKIAEIRLKVLQIDQDARSEIGKELGDIRAKLAEQREKQISAEDQLKRTDLRSPQDGFVHQLAIHTVGGVVQAGEPIMLIVPDGEALAIEAHVDPKEINQIHMGQKVVVRFPGLGQRTTPEIDGAVTLVSADLTQDEKSSAPYYMIRVSLPADQVDRLGSVKLMPGMPVEAFVETPQRTVLYFLVKPMQDQIERAFRER